MNLPPPGDYTAKLSGRIVPYEAESGAFCVALPTVISQGPNTGFTTKATVVLVKSDGTLIEAAIKNLRRIFDWDGQNPYDLADKDFNGTEFLLADCKHEEYDGKTFFKPGWVNPLGGNMQMPEPGDRKTFLAKYGAKFRAYAGGTPTKSSKPTGSPTIKEPPAASDPAPSAPPTQSSPTATMQEAWTVFVAEFKDLDRAQLEKKWFEVVKQVTGKIPKDVTPEEWPKVIKAAQDDIPF